MQLYFKGILFDMSMKLKNFSKMEEECTIFLVLVLLLISLLDTELLLHMIIRSVLNYYLRMFTVQRQCNRNLDFLRILP